MTSGFPTRRSVSPGCPFCPPVFLPERSRRLVVRGGFFNPSLEGGLPLLLLFNPRRRSSSATRALAAASSPFNATICSFCKAPCASSSSTCSISLWTSVGACIPLLSQIHHSDTSFFTPPSQFAAPSTRADRYLSNRQ